MAGILMDYHMLFIVLTFLLLIITVLLLFIEPTVEKTTAAMIFIMIGIILCIFCYYSFYNINLVGVDSTGTVVSNDFTSMDSWSYLFMGIGYINIMLIVYCGYLFIKKPWDKAIEEEREYLEGRRIRDW